MSRCLCSKLVVLDLLICVCGVWGVNMVTIMYLLLVYWILHVQSQSNVPFPISVVVIIKFLFSINYIHYTDCITGVSVFYYEWILTYSRAPISWYFLLWWIIGRILSMSFIDSKIINHRLYYIFRVHPLLYHIMYNQFITENFTNNYPNTSNSSEDWSPQSSQECKY